MNKLWMLAGALCLSGCASNSETAPATNVAAPLTNEVQPQIVATIAPPAFPTATPATPMMPENADANSGMSFAPTDGVQQLQANDTKSQQVVDLRSDMSRLQKQRDSLTQQKTEFGVRHPNAKSEERALGSDFPDNARMAQYNQQLDDIDSRLSAKQKQIDDLMLSR